MGLVCFTRVDDFRLTTRYWGLLYEIYSTAWHLGYISPILGFDHFYYDTFSYGIFYGGMTGFWVIHFISVGILLSLRIGWVFILYYFTFQMIYSSVQILFMLFVHFTFPASCIPDRLLWIFPEQISTIVSSVHTQSGIFRHHSGW